MNLNEKIKQLRKERNWSQDKLGQKIGLDGRQVCRYEKGTTKPSSETLQKIAAAFGVPVDFLINDNEEESLKSFGIKDKELLKYFQGIDQMNEEERKAVKFILESIMMRNKVKEFFK